MLDPHVECPHFNLPESLTIFQLSTRHGFKLAVIDVLLRGPHLTGGWFRTGDSGWIDKEGQLWLAGRLKDVIRSGSENVAASETERVRHVSANVVGLISLTMNIRPCLASSGLCHYDGRLL